MCLFITRFLVSGLPKLRIGPTTQQWFNKVTLRYVSLTGSCPTNTTVVFAVVRLILRKILVHTLQKCRVYNSCTRDKHSRIQQRDTQTCATVAAVTDTVACNNDTHTGVCNSSSHDTHSSMQQWETHTCATVAAVTDTVACNNDTHTRAYNSCSRERHSSMQQGDTHTCATVAAVTDRGVCNNETQTRVQQLQQWQTQ